MKRSELSDEPDTALYKICLYLFLHAIWAESWASTTTRLHKLMPTPSHSGQGVGLSRRAWTRLNRRLTGVSRFGGNMLRWGLSTSDSCEQTADHIMARKQCSGRVNGVCRTRDKKKARKTEADMDGLCQSRHESHRNDKRRSP